MKAKFLIATTELGAVLLVSQSGQEFKFDSMARAIEVAAECSDNRDAFGWQGWEIWSNNPHNNYAWERVAYST